MISLEKIVRAVEASSAAIMIPDLPERRLYCYASFNIPKAWVDIKNSFDEKIPGGSVEVYLTGKPAVTNQLK